MSMADKIFKDMCKDILENGTDTRGEKVRPHWEDGASAYTIKKFGVVNRYDLRKEFPALTLRRTALKSAMDEILWIYQKKSNRLADLNSHIWDQWEQPDGTIGTAYGYVIGEKFEYRGEQTDQMDYVLKQLRENPYSRRIMTNMYQYHDLATGALDPCCYSVTYNVTREQGSKAESLASNSRVSDKPSGLEPATECGVSEQGSKAESLASNSRVSDKPSGLEPATGCGKLILNMVLNQRSQDVLAANNWNVCQYAILLMMVAQVNDMIPGELVHVIADAHIYDRHIDAIKELIGREEHPAPRVYLNPEIKDFYKFTTDDLHIEDYVTGEQIRNIPVAV